MRILILINNDIGLYNFRKELIQELINQGNEVVISLPYGPKVKELVNLGCQFIDTPIDRRGINPLKDFKLFIHYLKILKAIKPDKIYSYTIKPNIYGGLACKYVECFFIPTVTGLGSALQSSNAFAYIIRKLYRWSFSRCERVIFENAGNRDYFIKHRIIASCKAVVVNGAGVNLGDFPYAPLVFDGPTISFLFMGRIMKEKGVEELFYAAERIKKKYEHVEFIILGFYEDDYKQRVSKLTEDKIIKFEGFQDNVKEYIKKSHCVILPSYHEGMSNTLLEAGAMGRPLITTDIHGCKEAVVNNKTGFLCRVKDGGDLLNKLEDFLSLSHEQMIEMGKQSRSHIEKNFNRKEIVHRVMAI
ncbi:MAG: glycosyltransferase family 4 protein [Clostridia bacterium]|nr:glycosyltransferase family 4 protein [Clostridia bacterium]